MTIYQQEGYKNRRHYLQCMAEDYNVPITTVLALASVLGAGEDFDALVTELEDLADYEMYLTGRLA